MQGELAALLELHGQGVVKPIVDQIYPPQQAADAHRFIQNRHNFGKVLFGFAS
jgi:NADPH:quinone reductase-like Zn-dependent oxidoreductase